jgi:hypothetical protein
MEAYLIRDCFGTYSVSITDLIPSAYGMKVNRARITILESIFRLKICLVRRNHSEIELRDLSIVCVVGRRTATKVEIEIEATSNKGHCSVHLCPFDGTVQLTYYILTAPTSSS